MSVKTASEFVTRFMRAAIKETISPANQGTRTSSTRRPLNEACNVSRQFGHELHQRHHAYTGAVDEFGSPVNTVDNWRLLFSQPEGKVEAANGVGDLQKRQGER